MNILLIDDHNPEQGLWPPHLIAVDWDKFSQATNFEAPHKTDLLLGIQGGPDFSWAEEGTWEAVYPSRVTPWYSPWPDPRNVEFFNIMVMQGKYPLTEQYVKEYFYPEKVSAEEIAYYAVVEHRARLIGTHFNADNVGFTGVYW